VIVRRKVRSNFHSHLFQAKLWHLGRQLG